MEPHDQNWMVRSLSFAPDSNAPTLLLVCVWSWWQVFCARDAGNINVKIPCFDDNREVSPLHLAAENGHVETVIALLDQFKADVTLRDSDGNSALHSVVHQPYHPYRMRDRDYFYATAKVG